MSGPFTEDPTFSEPGEVSEGSGSVEQPEPRWDRVMANSGSHWVSLNWASEQAPTPGDGAAEQ